MERRAGAWQWLLSVTKVLWPKVLPVIVCTHIPLASRALLG